MPPSKGKNRSRIRVAIVASTAVVLIAVGRVVNVNPQVAAVGVVALAAVYLVFNFGRSRTKAAGEK